MKPALTFLLGSLMLAVMQAAYAQDEALSLPKSIEAGSAFLNSERWKRGSNFVHCWSWARC